MLFRSPPEGSRGSTGWATYPGGAHGLKWEGNQPLVCWCAPPWAPLRLGLETLGVGTPPPGLGGKFPPLPPPPLEIPSPRAGAPLGGLYKEGGERAAAPMLLAPPSPIATPLPLVEARRSPAEITAASTTTPSCCWISVNLSSPPCWIKKEETSSSIVRVLNAEVLSVQHYDHR